MLLYVFEANDDVFQEFFLEKAIIYLYISEWLEMEKFHIQK